MKPKPYIHLGVKEAAALIHKHWGKPSGLYKQPRYLGPAARAQEHRDAAAKHEKEARKIERRHHPLSNAKLRAAMKPKRIRPVSKRRAAALKLYAVAKAAHLKEHPNCQKCGYHKDVSIHHVRGRVGTLLYDDRYFKSLCRLCHAWVHQFPQQATAMGYLAQKGEWNTKPEIDTAPPRK